MTLGYGISGIGYNPLGNVGLGMTGAFSSYDNYMPSMMGMGAGAYGMGGMLNMYPQFMQQMNQAQNNIQMSQLQHAANMQAGLLNNEVNGFRNTDSALINKMLTNSDIQQGVTNLYEKVRKGDQDGICEEFDKLKNNLYRNYKDQFKSRDGKILPSVSAAQCIEGLYNNIISAQDGGRPHSLRDDIIKHGESAAENGFRQGFKVGHSKRYVDETMNHCFGLSINDKESNDVKQTLSKGAGRTASVLQKGVYGAAAGVGAWAIGTGVTKLAAGIIGQGKRIPFLNGTWWKWGGKLAGAGFLVGMAADVIWQMSQDKKE